MIITKILVILPPLFKYFISAWESTQLKEKTLTNFISRLTIEETRIRTKERAENIAFTANKHQCKKNFKKGNIRPGVSHYCYKSEHWIKECRNWKAATLNEKYTGKKGKALVEAMSAKYNLEISSDALHMDSGAIEHMSNRREWFSSYKKFNSKKY